MGVFDKFLDIMKLNEDDYDDQYDEYDEGGFYDDDEWIQAKEEKGVYQLPTDICTYTANTGIPITEAVAIIAITRFEQKPLPIDYRELNIHVW